MKNQFVLASDFGTGGCKTVLTDQHGRVVAHATDEYPLILPAPGWFEQNPQDWLAALGRTIQKVLAQSGVDPRDILALGLDGVTHNVVLLDEYGQPLRPCITFYDTRSAAECTEIEKDWGSEVFQRTWNTPSPVWTWPQLLWVKHHQPAVWNRIRFILCQKDFVRNAVAPSRVTDFIDAAGTLLFDPCENTWIRDFTAALELPEDVFPQVVNPRSIAGYIDQNGARLTGLRAGTPVITGTTDTVAEVFGAGAFRPGQATVKLASVGRITSITTAPANHPRLLNYRHVIDGLWYPGTATKFATTAFRWLRDSLWANAAYDEMSAACETVPPGSDGLLFQPHLGGEWAPFWDDRLRANFIGLTLRHDRRHMTRAVMEGVAFALRSALEYASSLGLPFNEIRLIGQGVRSKVWKQIIADCLQRGVKIPVEKDAAFGTALLTGMGIGFYPQDPDQIEALIHLEEEILPVPDNAETYQTLFAIYQQADLAAQTISHQLNAYESQLNRGQPACQVEEKQPDAPVPMT